MAGAQPARGTVVAEEVSETGRAVVQGLVDQCEVFGFHSE